MVSYLLLHAIKGFLVRDDVASSRPGGAGESMRLEGDTITVAAGEAGELRLLLALLDGDVLTVWLLTSVPEDSAPERADAGLDLRIV